MPLRLPRETDRSLPGARGSPRRRTEPPPAFKGSAELAVRRGGPPFPGFRHSSAPGKERGPCAPLGAPAGLPHLGRCRVPAPASGRPARDLRRSGSARRGMAVPAPRPPRGRGGEGLGRGVPKCGGPSVLPPLPSPRGFDLGSRLLPGLLRRGREAGEVRGLPRSSLPCSGEMPLPGSPRGAARGYKGERCAGGTCEWGSGARGQGEM